MLYNYVFILLLILFPILRQMDHVILYLFLYLIREVMFSFIKMIYKVNKNTL